MRNRVSILLMTAALLLAMLACNFPGSTGDPPPASPVPVSTEAVLDLEQNLEGAAATAQTSGEVNVTLTEEQMTSLVALEAQKQSEPMLTKPQVFLRDGQVQLRGDVHQGGLNAPLVMNMTVSADDQGRPVYKVISAKLGPFPLPDTILSQLTDQIDQAFKNQAGSEMDKIFIENITIAEGQMVVRGRARQ